MLLHPVTVFWQFADTVTTLWRVCDDVTSFVNTFWRLYDNFEAVDGLTSMQRSKFWNMSQNYPKVVIKFSTSSQNLVDDAKTVNGLLYFLSVLIRVTGHLCGEFRGHRWIPRKGQWRGALMFSLICAWTNTWVNNREAGYLRRHCAHYNVTVMCWHRLWQRSVFV